MNKKLIALAVAAGIAAPLAAQAETTAYGHLQAEIAAVSNDGYGENNTGGSRTGTSGTSAQGGSALKMNDNKRGRLGIKASEDLGNGMSAIAKFEWQVDTTTGNLTDGARETFVGLKGGFGSIMAGRLKSAYKYTGGVKWDPFVTTYMEARKSGGMSGGNFGHNGFLSNSIGYTNKFGPVSLMASYGVDEGTGADTGASSAGNSGDITLGASMTFGSIEVIAAYAADADTDGNKGTSGADDEYDAFKVGIRWKSGPMSIAYQSEAVNNEGVDEAYGFLGFTYKIGATEIVAQLGAEDSDTNTQDREYMAVGAIHKFSKKTRVFVGHRTSSRDSTPSSDLSVTSLGLRVDF